jgi:hypothetical protein
MGDIDDRLTCFPDHAPEKDGALLGKLRHLLCSLVKKVGGELRRVEVPYKQKIEADFAAVQRSGHEFRDGFLIVDLERFSFGFKDEAKAFRRVFADCVQLALRFVARRRSGMILSRTSMPVLPTSASVL